MNSASSSSPAHCPECNAPLSPSEAHGLCARCLLKLGLAGQSGENSVADAGVRQLIPPPLFPFDFGGYRMLRLLGRGGMGAVYEAEQLESGRRVALKVLGRAIDSPEMRKRFLREGRLAASVNHPNSVYIFGTEEIEGAQVIVMELAAGGTLRDRIRNGPVPVREAVDAALQIIAGLEAAHACGVLHRDVKPANCFVAPDGTVKIGDYGLSISTLARRDSQLTANGVMLGTPSYAPPEQLRGDELDLRADIYSAGATLYSLLTARPPFGGENAVHVIAAVLDKPPKPIGEFRKDVPTGLAQIVARCLAKKHGDRFADYAALRRALLPFGSSAPAPAPLGLRFVAGLIDNALAFLPLIIMTVITGLDLSDARTSFRTPAAASELLAGLLFACAYFAGCEGRWGAAPGKGLCGLRVIGREGGAPGYAGALARAAIYLLAYLSGELFGVFGGETAWLLNMPKSWLGYPDLGTMALALLFVSARRRNHFCALHELASRTRTVVRPKPAARPRIHTPELTLPSLEGPRLGAYRVAGSIPGGALLAAYDELLRRHVWIRQCAAGTPPLDAARREVGRPSRLRWIGGARSGPANWDAFEAAPGKPLREIPAQPWAAMRVWLQDLAEEIESATKDGTLPAEIGIDHVRITADGRAMLLDEPWPSPAPAPLFQCADPAGARHFLSAVAAVGLDRSALPLHARDFLDKLGASAFDCMALLLGNLQSLLAKPAAVSRRRRFAAMALLPGAAVFVSLFIVLVGPGFAAHRRAAIAGPRELEWDALTKALNIYAIERGEAVAGPFGPFTSDLNPKTKSEMQESDECYLSGHFRKLIQSPAFDHDAQAAGLNAHQRDLAHSAIAAQPNPTREQLKYADETVGKALEASDSPTRMTAFLAPWLLAFLLLLISIGSLLGAVILGFDPILRMFGLAVVDRAGRPASRLRLLARGALIWSPLIAGDLAIVAAIINLRPEMFKVVWNLGIAAFKFAALAALVGVPWTILHPTAGPYDRLARTRVTPR